MTLIYFSIYELLFILFVIISIVVFLILRINNRNKKVVDLAIKTTCNKAAEKEYDDISNALSSYIFKCRNEALVEFYTKKEKREKIGYTTNQMWTDYEEDYNPIREAINKYSDFHIKLSKTKIYSLEYFLLFYEETPAIIKKFVAIQDNPYYYLNRLSGAEKEDYYNCIKLYQLSEEQVMQAEETLKTFRKYKI